MAAIIEELFRTIKFPLSIEQFFQLPQNPAYEYEYIDGEAWLTPRPKSYHALLDLHSFDPPIAMQTEEQTVIRRLAEEDWERLPAILAAAFHRVEPFAKRNSCEVGSEAETQGWATIPACATVAHTNSLSAQSGRAYEKSAS